MKASSRGIVVVFCLAVMGLVGTVFAERPDKFVRYVEATGDQFVDTEIIALPDTKAECKVEWMEFRDSAFLACKNASGDTRFYACYCLDSNGQMYPAVGTGSTISYNGQTLRFEKKRVYTYTSEFSAKFSDASVTNTITVDGTTVGQVGGKGLPDDVTFYVFARNLDGNADCHSKARCYGLKMWQNGVLVRDFKPCVKAGRAGLYDTVSQTIFYSSSSTDLVYDPKTDVNVPDVFVDYVEARAKSYINTGIRGRSGTSAKMEMAFLHDGDKGFLGARKGSNNRFYLLHHYERFTYGYGEYYKFAPCEIGRRYYVESSLSSGSQMIKIGEDGIDGSHQVVVNEAAATTIDTGLDMYIFALNYDGQASNMAEARVYWLQIYQDGQLVRDFKPCLKNGVAALYDEVSKKIFYPEGEALAYEYDNSVAADEDSVAFVEYIESDGNAYLDTQVVAESPLRATGTFSYVHARTHAEEKMYLSGFWHRSYLGCKQDDDLNQMLMINESNQYFLFGYGEEGKGLYNSSDPKEFRSLAGNKFDFDVSFADGEQMLKISSSSDTWTASETWGGDVDAGGNLYLFACNHVNKKKAVNQSAARCYGLTLYKNDKVVRNFRPCVKDGKAALYDTVSKRVFYPTPFIPAEGHTGDVLSESYDAPVEALLEYVETDGTQYVDTGVAGKIGTTVEFKESRIDSDGAEKCFLGSRSRANSSNVRYFPWYHAGGWDIGIGYGSEYGRIHKNDASAIVPSSTDVAYKYYSGSTLHAKVSLSSGSQRVSLFDESTKQWKVVADWSIGGAVDTGKNLFLFAENDNGEPKRNCWTRFYFLKIRQNGKYLCHLRPARLKNGLPVLWDVKNDRAYLPKGSDGRIVPFSAAGPESSYEKSYGCVLVVK
jgi:hypothetical protein